MNDAETLLARLDANLGVADMAIGVATAEGFHALLGSHHLAWDDVLTPGSRLAKLCGRLGSTFEAERLAAYSHAVRLILRDQSNWSGLVRLPAALHRAPDPPAQAAAHSPDGDWIITIQKLVALAAWRSDAEQILLEALASRITVGMTVEAAEARWLRDIWWHAELHNPDLEDDAA